METLLGTRTSGGRYKEMDDDAKYRILEVLNMEARFLHDEMKSGISTQYSYAECYMEAILWTLKVLGYDYYMEDSKELGHIVYTDIVEDPDK